MYVEWFYMFGGFWHLYMAGRWVSGVEIIPHGTWCSARVHRHTSRHTSLSEAQAWCCATLDEFYQGAGGVSHLYPVGFGR